MLKIWVDHSNPYLWEVGQKIPKHIVKTISSYIKVEADGMELDWIIQNIINIPYHKSKSIQTWNGDLANFIINCIDY